MPFDWRSWADLKLLEVIAAGLHSSMALEEAQIGRTLSRWAQQDKVHDR